MEYKWLTRKQIAEGNEYPFNLAAISYLLFNRNENGLSEAVRKIGKTVLIRKDLFDKWLDSKKDNENEQ